MAAEGAHVTEAELVDVCGHLYASIALESFATTLMILVFSYLLLLITNKGRLQNPARAVWSLVSKNVKGFVAEVWGQVKKIWQMPDLPLEQRFAMCRKVNQAMCMFQILIAMLTIERWLHINNVNGFRYLGYSMTCPPMQVQLIVLIAPVAPCFKFHVVTTYVVTVLMLWAGYASSVIRGVDFYEGCLWTYLNTWDLDDLRPSIKFWFAFAAVCCQVYLSFVQIPLLYLYYRFHGGEKAGLPQGYPWLLLNVSMSWLAFPVWWVLSYEGMGIITDTKMNAAGFCMLNVLSKGSFTLQMLGMVQRFKLKKRREEARAQGRPSIQAEPVGLFESEAMSEGFRLSKAERAELAANRDSGQRNSQESAVIQVLRPHDDGDRDRDHEKRNSGRRESQESAVIQVLRPYDRCVDRDSDDGKSGEAWKALEPAFKVYLTLCGVRASKWKLMGTMQRMDMREAYEEKLHAVDDDDGESEDEFECSTSAGLMPEGLDALRKVEAAPRQDNYPFYSSMDTMASIESVPVTARGRGETDEAKAEKKKEILTVLAEPDEAEVGSPRDLQDEGFDVGRAARAAGCWCPRDHFVEQLRAI